jgi:hypothetical protein
MVSYITVWSSVRTRFCWSESNINIFFCPFATKYIEKLQMNINNLLTESEDITGKYPTKDCCIDRAMARSIQQDRSVGYFPVLPERLRSVRFLLLCHFTFVKNGGREGHAKAKYKNVKQKFG